MVRRLVCAAVAVCLAVWLVIGNVLADEAIIACRHATVIGKAGLFTLLAWGDVLAILFIWYGPFAESHDL